MSLNLLDGYASHSDSDADSDSDTDRLSDAGRERNEAINANNAGQSARIALRVAGNATATTVLNKVSIRDSGADADADGADGDNNGPGGSHGSGAAPLCGGVTPATHDVDSADCVRPSPLSRDASPTTAKVASQQAAIPQSQNTPDKSPPPNITPCPQRQHTSPSPPPNNKKSVSDHHYHRHEEQQQQNQAKAQPFSNKEPSNVRPPQQRRTKTSHKQRRTQRQHRRQSSYHHAPQIPTSNHKTSTDLPPDLIAELLRTGHDPSSINLSTVDARTETTIPTTTPVAATATIPSKTIPTTSSTSLYPTPRHTPQHSPLPTPPPRRPNDNMATTSAAGTASGTPMPSHVVHKTAERIAKTRGVTRLERSRHQITALAADAAALNAVRATFPTMHHLHRRQRRR